MTLGEKLLELTDEYRTAKEARSYGIGHPAGREPSVIAAEYETTITELLAR